ncbi:glycosyltransferase family 2 protein [Curtobacterium sp. MCSS17_007]|uniref:glycosyltransferase n=1 Tax=Curtobacterium sp. MCSS17_007 TaxID=2175646 RepID=UPI0015E8C9B4|nr:glycosyltransferase family 2 protein [Curtobacterium sp. MCSS17_007]WIE76512.1 glycosyltransferase family 2 protein [Curtobacterium sp. MCSS17_007]
MTITATLLTAAGPLLQPNEGTGPAGNLPNRGTTDVPTGGSGQAPQVAWSLGEWIGYSALIAVSVLLTVIALTTLWWMLHAWRSRDALKSTSFSQTPLPAAHRFTLLVPGRHEQDVMGETLDMLAKQDHPDFEIIAIVGEDDPETDAVVRAAAARHPELIRVVVDDTAPKNKPKAMNLALQYATGDVVGVFDAEDEVYPKLLSLVDSRFQETGADVVQGGVQLMNFKSSWWSLRNVLEYYFWFRSRLHFHAGSKFIPLGGNTVFVTKERLEWSNGWDAHCLAEDCELGVRLSADGAKVVVAYSPEAVTREETPPTFASLLKQRTRWNQGFLQVLGKGEWKKLPSFRQRFFARYMLTMPFIQAATGLLIPLSVLMILFVKVPTPVALVSFIPVAPTLMLLAVEVVGLNEFGRIYKEKVRIRDYVKLVLGLVPYQVFLAAAAVRAVVRHVKGQNGWEKTEHTGQHRTGGSHSEVVGFASELTSSSAASSSSSSPSSSSERELAGSTTGGAR